MTVNMPNYSSSLILSVVVTGNVFPVTEHPFNDKSYLGKGVRTGYQSHVTIGIFSLFFFFFFFSLSFDSNFKKSKWKKRKSTMHFHSKKSLTMIHPNIPWKWLSSKKLRFFLFLFWDSSKFDKKEKHKYNEKQKEQITKMNHINRAKISWDCFVLFLLEWWSTLPCFLWIQSRRMSSLKKEMTIL